MNAPRNFRRHLQPKELATLQVDATAYLATYGFERAALSGAVVELTYDAEPNDEGRCIEMARRATAELRRMGAVMVSIAPRRRS